MNIFSNTHDHIAQTIIKSGWRLMISEFFANHYDNDSRRYYQSQRVKRWREMAGEICDTSSTALAELSVII